MRFLIFIVFLSIFLFSGCTLNNEFSSFEQYYNSIKERRNNNQDYIIEATLNKDSHTFFVKSFIKGREWRTEVFDNNGIISNSYYKGYGSLLYTCLPRQKACQITNYGKFNNEELAIVMESANPANILVKWDNLAYHKGCYKHFKTGKIANNSKKFNSHQCRLIKFADNGNACINDDLGIAIYHKYRPSAKNTESMDEVILKNVELKTPTSNQMEFNVPNDFKVLTRVY